MSEIRDRAESTSLTLRRVTKRRAKEKKDVLPEFFKHVSLVVRGVQRTREHNDPLPFSSGQDSLGLPLPVPRSTLQLKEPCVGPLKGFLDPGILKSSQTRLDAKPQKSGTLEIQHLDVEHPEQDYRYPATFHYPPSLPSKPKATLTASGSYSKVGYKHNQSSRSIKRGGTHKQTIMHVHIITAWLEDRILRYDIERYK